MWLAVGDPPIERVTHMAWPVDGRGGLTKLDPKPPMTEQEFQDQIVEVAVQTSLKMFSGYAFPEGLDEEGARKYHGNHMKYFSYFAWKFPSWLMNVAAACPYQDVRRTIIEDLVDEEVGDPDAQGSCHIEVLYEEAEACGVSRQEIFDAEATPALIACVHALENMSLTLGWQTGLAAISGLEVLSSKPAADRRSEILSSTLTSEQLERARSGRDAVSLAKRTGLEPEQLMFAALHEYKDQEHGGDGLQLLVDHGRTRELQESMLWGVKAGIEVFGVMREEINRLACASVGLQTDGVTPLESAT
jgi:pyrroloquinoline quinone (PQQ) biosynthesis protein C